MPDSTHKTISATQVPALFGVSPYVTRWMLYKAFADGMSIDKPADARMSWGTKLEPLIIEQAASDLALEVKPHGGRYIRRGQVGATRDATIITPDRGPGAFETKAVFEYGTWMRDWGGGAKVPRHYEIQLQVQIMVGDGEQPFTHGRIAAWVAGEMHYFEREPIPQLWTEIEIEARRFFEAVAAKLEPDPFGSPIEAPLLAQVFAVVPGKVISLADQPNALALAEKVRSYDWFKKQERDGARAAELLRGELLALAKDAETVEFIHGIKVTRKQSEVAEHVRKASKRTTINVFIPENLPDTLFPPGAALKQTLTASLESADA